MLLPASPPPRCPPHCRHAARLPDTTLPALPPQCCSLCHAVLLLPMSRRCSSCRRWAVAPCRAVLLLPVSPRRRLSCRRWAVASRAAVCCCSHCRRRAARRVAVGQLRVMQWCAAAHTAAAAAVLVVSSLCGCHCHGGCHWVVPAHTI